MPHLSAHGPYFNDAQFNAIMQRFISMIQTGNRIEVAAQYVGIHRDSLYEWMKRGSKESLRRLRPKYKHKKSENDYVRFYETIQDAINFAEMRDLKTIDDAAQGQFPEYDFVDEIGADGKNHKIKKIIGWGIVPDPRWAAWKLERRLPKLYGRNETLTLEGGDKPVAYELQWGVPIAAKGKGAKKK